MSRKTFTSPTIQLNGDNQGFTGALKSGVSRWGDRRA